jgi:cytochrome c oxidase subunit 4
MNRRLPERTFYILVTVALLLLLTLTAWLSTLHLGPWSLPVALTIAVIKATLVILFFMEVRVSGQIVRVMVGASLVWLMLLLSGTTADYLSRAGAGSKSSDVRKDIAESHPVNFPNRQE